nr:hypothetical protein [Haladaptatus halobius]
MQEAIFGMEPKVAESAFVSKMSYLIGDVTVGERSSLWPFVCLRGDEKNNPTTVGEECNIQEFTMLHGHRLGMKYPSATMQLLIMQRSRTMHLLGCKVQFSMVQPSSRTA